MFIPTDIGGLPRQAGNFIFASGDTNNPVPVFIEEAGSVRASALDRWPTAQETYGATLIYLHIDPVGDSANRQSEKNDLVEAYQPAMNRGAHGE